MTTYKGESTHLAQTNTNTRIANTKGASSSSSKGKAPAAASQPMMSTSAATVPSISRKGVPPLHSDSDTDPEATESDPAMRRSYPHANRANNPGDDDNGDSSLSSSSSSDTISDEEEDEESSELSESSGIDDSSADEADKDNPNISSTSAAAHIMKSSVVAAAKTLVGQPQLSSPQSYSQSSSSPSLSTPPRDIPGSSGSGMSSGRMERSRMGMTMDQQEAQEDDEGCFVDEDNSTRSDSVNGAGIGSGTLAIGGNNNNNGMRVGDGSGKVDFLASLPPELSLYLLTFVPAVPDLSLSCQLVSRTWNALARDGIVWREKFYEMKGWRCDEEMEIDDEEEYGSSRNAISNERMGGNGKAKTADRDWVEKPGKDRRVKSDEEMTRDLELAKKERMAAEAWACRSSEGMKESVFVAQRRERERERERLRTGATGISSGNEAKEYGVSADREGGPSSPFPTNPTVNGEGSEPSSPSTGRKILGGLGFARKRKSTFNSSGNAPQPAVTVNDEQTRGAQQQLEPGEGLGRRGKSCSPNRVRKQKRGEAPVEGGGDNSKGKARERAESSGAADGNGKTSFTSKLGNHKRRLSGLITDFAGLSMTGAHGNSRSPSRSPIFGPVAVGSTTTPGASSSAIRARRQSLGPASDRGGMDGSWTEVGMPSASEEDVMPKNMDRPRTQRTKSVGTPVAALTSANPNPNPTPLTGSVIPSSTPSSQVEMRRPISRPSKPIRTSTTVSSTSGSSAGVGTLSIDRRRLSITPSAAAALAVSTYNASASTAVASMGAHGSVFSNAAGSSSSQSGNGNGNGPGSVLPLSPSSIGGPPLAQSSIFPAITTNTIHGQMSPPDSPSFPHHYLTNRRASTSFSMPPHSPPSYGDLYRLEMEMGSRKMLDWQKLFRDRWILHRRWETGQSLSMMSLKGHRDSVYCLQFDKNKVITGSRDRTIKVWSPDTGELLHSFKAHDASILCLKYDNKSQTLITGSSDQKIRVWDMRPDPVTGNKWGWKVKMTLRGHEMGVLDLAFDDNWIVSCSKDTSIRVWRRDTGAHFRRLSGHRGPVNAVQLRGDIIVSASGDSLMKMWSISTGQVVRVFQGHERGLACVKYSLTGKYLATGSNDKTVRIWDVATGECLRVLEGHTDLVRSIWFDDIRGRLLSGGYDKTLKLWDSEKGALLIDFQKGHESLVFDVAFDYRRILSCSHDQRILVLDFCHGLDVRRFS